MAFPPVTAPDIAAALGVAMLHAVCRSGVPHNHPSQAKPQVAST